MEASLRIRSRPKISDMTVEGKDGVWYVVKAD